MSFDSNISEAWKQAADDLGVLVVAPFILTTTDGEPLIFEAHILNFGGPNGTVAGNEETQFGKLKQLGSFFCSNLYASYRRYDRQHFIDTLNDWGWFGEKGKEPVWYTGKPWS
jgi:hypothetical protein